MVTNMASTLLKTFMEATLLTKSSREFHILGEQHPNYIYLPTPLLKKLVFGYCVNTETQAE